MPRIFDNIDKGLLPALRNWLESSHRADFCVGYFNLLGWREIDDLIDCDSGKEGHCCRHDERAALLEAIARAGIGSHSVFLVCIEQKLESWLLAEEAKIGSYLSTAAHPYPVSRVGRPDRVPQPEAAMINHFKASRNGGSCGGPSRSRGSRQD